MMLCDKLASASFVFILVACAVAQQGSCSRAEECNRTGQSQLHRSRRLPSSPVLLQLSKVQTFEVATVKSSSTSAVVVLRMQTFRQEPANVASVIQCGIQAILSATMQFSVAPPRVMEGILTLGDDLLTCVEKILTPHEQALEGVSNFKQAWGKSFSAIPEAAASIQSDIDWYMRDGYHPALIRAIGSIIGESGLIVTNFLPADVAGEILKYLNAIVETFDTMGTSWDQFAQGNTVEGIEAIYWGLRAITDNVMPDVLKNDTVYGTVIGTLDFVLGNLSKHVLEYERLILESNVCWRTEKSRGRVRPAICPSEQYFHDGQGHCYPLQNSLISVGTSSTLDSALQRKGGGGDGGYAPAPRAIPAQCDTNTEFNEKHGQYCYTPCNNGWQPKQDNVLKCISACEGKFPAESPGMCGRDQGIMTKAIMEMVTVVLNSAFTLAENIMKMQEDGVNAEVLSDTIQIFIDMGKPFARPICPEGEAPTPAPNPAACSKPCTPGFDGFPGQCRLETGGMVICLPAGPDGGCFDGQATCPLTPAPTLMLDTTAPTSAPTGWVDGGRRRAQLRPDAQSTPSAAPTPLTTDSPTGMPTEAQEDPTSVPTLAPTEDFLDKDDYYFDYDEFLDEADDSQSVQDGTPQTIG